MMKRITIIALMFAFVLAYASAYAFKIAFVGDSRGGLSTWQSSCVAIGKEKPDLVLHSGDMWDGYTQGQWVSAIQADPTCKALLDANKLLVAWGNHEDEASTVAVKPSVVRDSKGSYAFTEGNCFFACGGYSGGSYIATQLATAASKDARWRFGWMHCPVYGTGSHPANGNTTLESACDANKATLIHAGHNHTYERTYLMYNKAVVSTPANVYNLKTTPGTVYMTNGLNGAPAYSVSKQTWGAVQTGSGSYVVICEVGNDTCKFTTKTLSGTVYDQWIIIHHLAGTVGIAPVAGNTIKQPIVVRPLGNNLFILTGTAGTAYTIIGLSGKIVASGKMTSAEQQLNLSGVHKGIFIVKINNCIQKIQVL